MGNYSVPTGQQQAIKSTIQERSICESEISRLHNALQQQIAKKQTLEGKLAGIMQSLAIIAGFDLEAEITLSEDLTTLTGQELPQAPEEKTD